MAINVKKYASSGLPLVHYAVVDTAGYLNGSTATPPAAGAAAGDGMAQLVGSKNFPFKPSQSQKNTVTGDDRAIAQFLYEPTELPAFQPTFGVADYTFDALVNSMVINDLGDTSILLVQPQAPTYRDMLLMVQRQAKSQAAGSLGSSMWSGLVVLKANISPLGSDNWQERGDAAFLYDVITNNTDCYPWGTAFTVLADGSVAAPAFKFTSPWRRLLWRWTGNNVLTAFTLPVTPAAEDGNALVIYQDGVKLVYGAGAGKYTVVAATKTVTFGTAPTANAKLVAWVGYV
jgi:hypothetical protein